MSFFFDSQKCGPVARFAIVLVLGLIAVAAIAYFTRPMPQSTAKLSQEGSDARYGFAGSYVPAEQYGSSSCASAVSGYDGVSGAALLPAAGFPEEQTQMSDTQYADDGSPIRAADYDASTFSVQPSVAGYFTRGASVFDNASTFVAGQESTDLLSTPTMLSLAPESSMTAAGDKAYLEMVASIPSGSASLMDPQAGEDLITPSVRGQNRNLFRPAFNVTIEGGLEDGPFGGMNIPSNSPFDKATGYNRSN